MKYHLILIIAVLLICSAKLHCDTSKTMLERAQPIAIDTTNKSAGLGVTSESNAYTKKQDSIYRQALKLNIPFMVRAITDYKQSEGLYQLFLKTKDNVILNTLISSFGALPVGVFAPTDVELVQRQINIINALSVPTVYTFNPDAGFKLDLHQAGVFLGIFQDISPTIKYSLAITADIEIVVYSMQAMVVATLFKGTQKPGTYSITWNGRDDNGKMLEMGDYFAEVKIGNERYVRKHIRLGDYK